MSQRLDDVVIIFSATDYEVGHQTPREDSGGEYKQVLR